VYPLLETAKKASFDLLLRRIIALRRWLSSLITDKRDKHYPALVLLPTVEFLPQCCDDVLGARAPAESEASPPAAARDGTLHRIGQSLGARVHGAPHCAYALSLAGYLFMGTAQVLRQTSSVESILHLLMAPFPPTIVAVDGVQSCFCTKRFDGNGKGINHSVLCGLDSAE
jgi:hypothetical protein